MHRLVLRQFFLKKVKKIICKNLNFKDDFIEKSLYFMKQLNNHNLFGTQSIQLRLLYTLVKE